MARTSKPHSTPPTTPPPGARPPAAANGRAAAATTHTLRRALLFAVDERSGQTIIQVIDRQTDRVIRQIPSTEVLEVAGQLKCVGGLLFKVGG